MQHAVIHIGGECSEDELPFAAFGGVAAVAAIASTLTVRLDLLAELDGESHDYRKRVG